MQTVTGVVGLVSPDEERDWRLSEVERDMGAVEKGLAKQAEALGLHGELLARHDERQRNFESDLDALWAEHRAMRTELLASLKAFRDEYRADRDKKAEGSRAVTVATISGIFLVVAAIVTAVAAVIGS